MRVMRTRRIGTSDALKRVVAGLLVAGLSGAAAQQPVEAQTVQAKKPKPSPTATVIDLGTLGTGSNGFGVNDAGQVVGSSGTLIIPSTNTYGPHAFLYSNGSMTDLGTLNAPGSSSLSQANAINNNGQIVGESGTAGGWVHAFLYSNGVMTDLGTLGPEGTSIGYGINNSGQVVGLSSTSVADVSHAFLYSNGVMTDLGTLGGLNSAAYAINNNGQVTGVSGIAPDSQTRHAFLYSNGVMTDLGTLDDQNAFSEGKGINDLGQVVGRSLVGSSGLHAFLYSNGRMVDLGTLPGHSESWAQDINNAGQIVGTSLNPRQNAFLYTNGQMIDLNTLLPANSGWALFYATSINDKGQITGTGTYNGQIRAYLLTLPKVLPVAGNSSIKGNGTLGNSGRDIQTNFVARSTSKKVLGNVVFTDKINNVALKSTEITSVQVNGNEGVIYGVGRVNGVSGFSFVLTTTDDVSSNKGGDGFSLQISNGYSHTSDFDSGGVRVND